MNKPAKLKKEKILGVRLYQYQHKLLFDLAKSKDTTPSKLIRNIIQSELQKNAGTPTSSGIRKVQ